MRFQLAIKRTLDIASAAILLVILSPILLATALLVKLTMGEPVLFAQPRAGCHGNPFVLFKFRTMRNTVNVDGSPLPDSERLTRTGRFLRKTSLDELPQLWNVLKGDMSLVGPRPLLIEYLAAYTPEHRRRHDVMPGITGWAQVNGRQALFLSERRDLDVWYVDHWNLWLDLKIIWLTFWQVVSKRNVRLEQKMSDVDDLGLMETLKSSKSISVE